MKYYILLPFVLCLACRAARSTDIKLSGDYTIDDYQMTGNLDAGSSAGRSFVGSVCQSKWHFSFYTSDSVRVAPVFGMKYLGDTLFRYNVVDDSLVLTHNDNVRKLAVTDDGGGGLIRLHGLDNDIAGFSLGRIATFAGRRH